jgi:RNA polymerase sigma factor (sigma-70 family)
MIVKSTFISFKEQGIDTHQHLPLPDESQVWKEFKNGSKEAFFRIYINYVNVLYNYGRKIINEKDLVEDCIQDLFLEIWESREKLSDTNSIKYYLLKALRIKIFKELNKRNKYLDKNALPENYDFNIVFSFEVELINEELSVEQKEKLSKVLEKLSQRQKEAVFLRYFDDLEYDEIASVMAINYQSVHNLIHRAIKILRENLVIEISYLLLVASFS